MKKYLKILVALILLAASIMSCTSCLGPIFGLFAGEEESSDSGFEIGTEADGESEALTESESQTESDEESESYTESEAATESESETESEFESESESESEIFVDLSQAPEKYGISSADITAVVKGLAKKGLSMHSVLVMRHGEVIAEGYAEPFDENSLHRMYSVSKSFVSMAIGLLAEEGKISLQDEIIEYFPEYEGDRNVDSRVAESKIEDLLKMDSAFKKVASCGDGQEDWVEAYFYGTAQKTAGGGYYTYDTGSSHILGVIVERVTGKDFLTYLKEEALLEIGFSEDSWCIDGPEGYAWAGSGVMCSSRDLALFANLVMNMGEYNGKQLLPREYVEAATTFKIATKEVEGDSDYYGRGYGYQIWINPYGFAFMGMGNQHAYCIPDKDLVIVCTADNQGNSDAAGIIYEHFEKYIIKKISDTPLADNRDAYVEMLDALENMEIPYVSGKLTSKRISTIDGKTYVCEDEDGKITAFRLDFDGDEGILTYVTDRGEKELRFGIGKNVECTLDEPQYSGETIGTPNGKGYRSYCSGAWRSDTIFTLRVQVIDDYFGNMTLTFNFSGVTPKLSGVKNAEWFLNEYKMSEVPYRKL